MSLEGISRRSLLKAGLAGLASTALPLGALKPARAAGDVVLGAVYVGPRDDYGWNQAHAVAMEVLKSVANVKVIEEENVPETDAVANTHQQHVRRHPYR